MSLEFWGFGCKSSRNADMKLENVIVFFSSTCNFSGMLHYAIRRQPLRGIAMQFCNRSKGMVQRSAWLKGYDPGMD